ncbi:MAG: type II 3-dehydroquinate dehydratase [Candidatus Izimaplasma sp.]|nr:type II 3-dehydroquinate dehydratase [Candidatus Izimaplasma bacterium]
MKLLVINGPNLNFLGIRNKDIYGQETYDDLVNMIQAHCEEVDVEVDCFQSNYEGAIIDRLQKAYKDNIDGIIINPAAYTHYSYAIRDGIASAQIPTVEIHISNIYKREAFRQISVIEPVCIHQIVGKGVNGYIEAIDYLKDNK